MGFSSIVCLSCDFGIMVKTVPNYFFRGQVAWGTVVGK